MCFELSTYTGVGLGGQLGKSNCPARATFAKKIVLAQKIVLLDRNSAKLSCYTDVLLDRIRCKIREILNMAKILCQFGLAHFWFIQIVYIASVLRLQREKIMLKIWFTGDKGI